MAAVLRITPTISSSLRRLALPSGGIRWYALDNSARGVKVWNLKDSTAISDDTNNVTALSKRVIDNVTRCGYSKCSELNKAFDNVKTVEELYEAEKILLRFRKGFNPIRSSTPLVVIRACIRLNKPNLALHFIKQKVQYGIFPSVNTYNILMDSFLAEKQYKRIVDTYNEMIKDELQPNAMSYYLAVFGYMLQEDKKLDDALDIAKDLCDKSLKKSRKNGLRAYHMLIRILTDKDDRENISELLTKIDIECPLYNTHDVYWRIKGYQHLEMIDKIYNIIDCVCNDPVLRVSEEIINSIENTDKLEEYKAILLNKEKLIKKTDY